MTTTHPGLRWAPVAALALVLTLSGCAGAPAEAAPSASPTMSSPSPASTPSPTPTPTVDPLLITVDGIGAFQRGGSFPDAVALLGETIDTESCPWFVSHKDANSVFTYLVSEVVTVDEDPQATDILDMVIVQDGGATSDQPLPHTAAGVGLRSP